MGHPSGAEAPSYDRFPDTIPLRCRLGYHPWKPWEEMEVVQIHRRYFSGAESVTDALSQQRVCPGCKLRQIRPVSKR